MKYALSIVMLLAVSAGSAMADQGQVSKDRLADLGLSSIQVMSDVQGEQIRGKGFAAVAGYSYAHTYGAGSADGYIAAGHHFAAGGSISFAASRYSYAVAGGGAIAVAY